MLGMFSVVFCSRCAGRSRCCSAGVLLVAEGRYSDACSCFLPVAGCVAVRARRESDDGEVVVSAGAGGGRGAVVPAAGGGRRRRRWAPADGGGPTRFDLRLGESIHIDGMGAVTLLEVEPAPLSGSNVPGGPPGAVVNISFAPGVSECWFGNSVKISLLGGRGLLSEWPLADWARLG